MSRPSFQFYPGDWRKNANLGRCSKAARGAWIDVLCVLHDSDEYGIARYPLKDLANASSCPVTLLRELVAKGVLKGADAGTDVEAFVYTPHSGRRDGKPIALITAQAGPLWYSSRMVKDEHVRHVRGEGTRFGDIDVPSPTHAPKHSPTHAPKPPLSDGPSSSSSSSSSSSPSGLKNPLTPRGALSALSLIPDVDASVARDWIALRRSKKAPVSETAVAGIRKEAAKAGMPLDAALRLCCERGWTGFKSEWLIQKSPDSWADRRDATLRGLTGANRRASPPTLEIVDVDAYRVG